MCDNVKFSLIAFIGCCVKRVDITCNDFNSLIITLEALKSNYAVQAYRLIAMEKGPCAICLYESNDFCEYVENYEE